MKIIRRKIQDEFESWFFKQKALIIYGARQVGKTTFVKHILKKRSEPSLYLNCDEPEIREMLADKNSYELRQIIGNHKIVVIDEAQRVRSIGITLKLMVDNFPEIQVIATGSTSLILATGIKESLAGRKIEFTLYPLSVEELRPLETHLDFLRTLPERLILGGYPGVVLSDSKEILLREISETLLYRDMVEIDKVRNPDQLRKLLQALAMQIGSEVSFSELGTMLQMDKDTISRYIQVLKEMYVIFDLPPYKTNLRNTLGKLRKIYFCDLGIRNALINNFNPIELRNDVGALWENYCVLERRKFNHNKMRFPNTYFWRAYDKAEIDYLEEINASLSAFEFKWNENRAHPPKAFFDVYPETPFQLVNRLNYLEFLT